MAKDKRQFTVGDKAAGADFSVAEMELLTLQIRDWFASDLCDRQYTDPFEAAKQKVKECLLAETAAGDPWRACPDAFEDRIRAKCLFDMKTGNGFSSPRAKSPLASRAITKGAKQAANSAINNMSNAPKFDQEAFREKTEKDILDAFPELDNPGHRPNVRRLSFLYSQQEVLDRELAQPGISASKRESALKLVRIIGQDAETTMNLLGIHPNQLQKSLHQKTSGAISDLVALLEDDKEFKERTKIWGLQLALQLYYMSQHYNGRKDGPQVEDFEIWHMTRTRPMEFTCKCGEQYTLVEGFEPADLRDYLIRQGVLVTEPAIPQLIPKSALTGLDTVDLGRRIMTDEEMDAEVTKLLEEDEGISIGEENNSGEVR